MEIYDLTRGKYHQIYEPKYDYGWGIEYMSHLGSEFRSVFAKPDINVSKLLNSIPIFLVESSMANEYIAVPECQCTVRVPEDNRLSYVKRFNIDKWVNLKEGYNNDPRERTPKGFTITDMLGIYIYSGERDLIPRRIFIWIDKIADNARKNTKIQSEITDNAKALFGLILYHEMAHALMDVELYGAHPAPNFSYANDYPYRFIEEAYANGIALITILDNLNSHQQTFIKFFVKMQGKGYSEGLKLYSHKNKNHYNIDIPKFTLNQWIGFKVLFNYDFALQLRDWWEFKDFLYNFWFFKTVKRDGWIAAKDHFGKWGIMELPSQKMVAGFKKYDRIKSFDKNGLCMVLLNHLCGYVNEKGAEQIPVEYDNLYSFENGITIARKDGCYGAIDFNNKTVIPFSLPYEDVRGFRNGRAAVKNAADMWGVIDTTGKEIVPCTNDKITL